MCRNRQVRCGIGLLAVIVFPPAVGSAQQVRYVDDSATGANGGSSWCDAYRYLQDALAAARASGGAVTEIRVAQGTYKPDQGANQTPGDRAASFELVNGVAIRGGYAGYGAADPNARDIPFYETILSGDLADNDTLPKSSSNSDCCFEQRTALCDDVVCKQAVCGVYAGCCTNSTWNKFCADAAAYLCCDLCSDANNCDNSYHVVASVSTDATAILDGFTITGGHANVLGPGDNDSGAGMINFGGSPTLKNCTFRENVSRVGYYYTGGGGGIYSRPPGQPTFSNCTFRGNTTDQSGGGGYGTGTFVNCMFIGNTAGFGGGRVGGSAYINCKFLGNSAYFGGGFAQALDAGGTFVNCLFSGNSAGAGGAVYSDLTASSFINCTFSGNTAELGCVLYLDESGALLANCISWGNADDSGMGESAQFSQGPNSGLSINYSSVQGWTGALGGVGNIGDDPAFINADGPDDVFGTVDDNARLMVTSPCINAGDNTALTSDTYDLDQDGDTSEPIPLDLGGDPRVVDGAVNMGAYEGPHQHFILDTDSVVVPEGGTATFSVRLALDPLGTVDAVVTPLLGDPDVFVLSGSALSFDSSNYSLGQYVTLGAAEDIDLFNGKRTIGVNAPGIDVVDLVATESDNEAVPTVLFVNWQAGAGLDIGTNWQDAFTKLDDALVLASNRTGASEIWVARGTYTPAPPGGDRNATIRLVEGVALYGGFAGGENNRVQRDPITNLTVLSGDLKGDDEPDFAKMEDNSYHVVTSIDTTAATVLDGFTISGGHANDLIEVDSGAGLINFGGSPTIRNLVFRSNRAIRYGGGMYTTSGDPSLSDCTFIGNLAEGVQARGGGLYNEIGSPTLTRCAFRGNRVSGSGGGMYSSGNPTLMDCVFESNVPSGMVQLGYMATLTNCLFIGNSGIGLEVRGATILNCRFLGNAGRGIYIFYGTPTLSNCVFAGNTDGAVYNVGSSPTIANCVLNGNTATQGSGIHNFLGSRPQITNCIIWGDSSPIYSDTSSTPNDPVVNNTCIQGGWTGAGGIGNISADPLFVDANGPDGVPGTEDDNLRLWPDSPCIDAGDNARVPSDALDLDNDGDTTEPIPFDLDGRWRFRDDPLTSDTGAGNPPVVDMGAFEFQPPCESDDDCRNVLFCDGVERCVDGHCEAGVDPCVGQVCDEVSNFCVDCRSSVDCSDGDHCNGVEICEAAGNCGMRMLVDCNGNALEDLCDIQEARSEDCNGNNIPDECEPDCQPNVVADSCDIATGNSLDCNTNTIPDECDLASGTSLDCNTNTKPDACDIASGISRDCNANMIPDECDITGGTSADCQPDGVPDDCQLAGNDYNGNQIPDTCEPSPPNVVWCADANSPDRTTRSLRFIVQSSVTAMGTPEQSAIKVTMIDLQHPAPRNLPQYPPSNFTTFDTATHGLCAGATTVPNYNGHHCCSDVDCLGPNNAVITDDRTCGAGSACTAVGEMNGCARWVGKPGTFYEAEGPPQSGPYQAARLQCTPYYWDWITETATGRITVVGAEIVPSSEYSVQAYGASCMGAEAGCPDVSAPVTMYTRRAGDVDELFNPPSTTTQPDAIDVAQLVNKFKNVAGAPTKPIAQLQPNLPELNTDISALDVVAAVDALKGFAYPFSGPCPCPSTVTCGGPCAGCPGMCVKTCVGGDNDGEPCINNTHCPGSTCSPAGDCRDRCGRCTP